MRGKFDPPEGRNARRFFGHLSEGQGARRFFDGANVGRGSTTNCTIAGLDEQKSGVSRLHFARPPVGSLLPQTLSWLVDSPKVGPQNF